MNLEDFNLIRLSSDYKFKTFDCKDEDLNDFLLNKSKVFLTDLVAVTYLLESDVHTVAFFSLLNDKISSENFSSNNQWNRFRKGAISAEKKFKSYPAMKIGRLAVSHDFKGNDIGTAILDYLKELFVDNNRTGCKFITVDAYDKSLVFYEKNGFKYFTDDDKGKDTRAMYLDLLPFTN
ncbi:GNAT family N-acetyltransferase [Mucilaginibacter sp. L196]|uniref:GNAT family N-acetyltransferase n=1 Tax=Mucilaginibacter sp. L196 TaxID=1641870 RepID=UPI00131B7958|nr:GNAT family N-acetyltransferase [Mucilaginibacter sp. L196]